MKKTKFLEFVQIDKHNQISFLININEITYIKYNNVNFIEISVKGLKSPIQYCDNRLAPKIYNHLKTILDIEKFV